MASAVNPFSSLVGEPTPTQGTKPSAPTEQMFLKLLVAQMKNQDPTNPSDPTQFVSELAQFSQLEQVIAIRTDIEKAAGLNPTDPANNQSTSSTNGQSNNSTTNQTTGTQN